ncbi:MAG: hypothetical protein JJV96_00030 [Alphaproteobacteria bacterium]|nr:hypothetical protein [Alphaproteobacteria bacterium]
MRFKNLITFLKVNFKVKKSGQSKIVEGGGSILETILAMSILLLSLPFVYNKLSEFSEEIRLIAMAKYIQSYETSINNYILFQKQFFEEDFSLYLEDDKFVETLSPYGLPESNRFDSHLDSPSLLVNIDSKNDKINIFLLFTSTIKENEDGSIEIVSDRILSNISNHIGVNSGYINSEGKLLSKSIIDLPDKYKINSSIVLKLSLESDKSSSSNYLYRYKAGTSTELNTLNQSLVMGDNTNSFSIYDVGTLKLKNAYIKILTQASSLKTESLITNDTKVYDNLIINRYKDTLEIDLLNISGNLNLNRNLEVKSILPIDNISISNPMAGKSTVRNLKGDTLYIGKLSIDNTSSLNIFDELVAYNEVSTLSLITDNLTTGTISLTDISYPLSTIDTFTSIVYEPSVYKLILNNVSTSPIDKHLDSKFDPNFLRENPL